MGEGNDHQRSDGTGLRTLEMTDFEPPGSKSTAVSILFETRAP